jgi:hypothetical protein
MTRGSGRLHDAADDRHRMFHSACAGIGVADARGNGRDSDSLLKYADVMKPVLPYVVDHLDFSVVVKSRAKPPKQWRWEIYRAGRASPIQQSVDCFEFMSEASRAGKTALKLLLSEHRDEDPAGV